MGWKDEVLIRGSEADRRHLETALPTTADSRSRTVGDSRTAGGDHEYNKEAREHEA
jgi:hypothetical protein